MKPNAGLQKKSFSLPYHGGEIWCEHLDGMTAELAVSKLEGDLAQLTRPSTSTRIALNVQETPIEPSLIDAISSAFFLKRPTRVAFVGVDAKNRRRFQRELEGAAFPMAFFDDFEEAKQWLIP